MIAELSPTLIAPAFAEAYLRVNGWEVLDAAPGVYRLWGRGEDEVFLPLRQDYTDYGRRVMEMLRALEQSEERPAEKILNDLLAAPYDVIRLRAASGDAAGSVPLDGGIAFVRGAKDLLVAAGCSVIDKRAYYLTNKPRRANDLVRQARLGQTERGSFIVTIYVPVPMDEEARELFTGTNEPFERKTTKGLLKAVGAACVAAEAAPEKGAAEPFRRAIKSGVSANLCEALTVIQEGTGAETMEVGVRWSYMVPQPIGVRPVTVKASYIPAFRQAGEFYRKSERPRTTVISGSVYRLQRGEADPQGTVTIRANFGEKTNLVKVQLGGDDYHNAVDAHDRKLPVLAEGTLVKEGRYYALLELVAFRVVSQLTLT